MPFRPSKYVEVWGIEPQTLGLQSRCSPTELNPRGAVSSATVSRRQQATVEALIYVIQHPQARALHYYFRLALDGVLVSWDVPTLPSHPEIVAPAGLASGEKLRGRWHLVGRCVASPSRTS